MKFMSEDEDDSIYNNEALEEAEEADEIDELEEGFMKGYGEDSTEECAKCGNLLVNYEDTIEIEYEDRTYRFCSDNCAEKFRKKHNI